MPQLDSYLFFNGNCAEALRFYEKTLGGKIEAMMAYAESPEPENCGGIAPDKIMHASLLLPGGRVLMASDSPPAYAKPMGGFSLSLSYDTAEEAGRIFSALAEGGRIEMPMAKTFWAESFGSLVDRFGTPWMVGGGKCTT